MRRLLTILLMSAIWLSGCAVDDAAKTVVTNCGVCRLVWTANGYMVVCDEPQPGDLAALTPLEGVK